MATAGALEYQELTSEGKNLSLQRCTNLKDLPSRRKQRENDHEHVAEKLQRRLPKFNQFSQNGVFGRDRLTDLSFIVSSSLDDMKTKYEAQRDKVFAAHTCVTLKSPTGRMTK